MSSRIGRLEPRAGSSAHLMCVIEQGAALIGQYVFKSAWVGGSMCLCMLMAVQIFGHTTVETYLRYYVIGFLHWVPYGLPEFLESVKNSLLQAI